VWGLVALSFAAYWYAIRVLGPSRVPAGQAVVTRRQVICWVSGVAILWIHADWPIHDIAESYLYSVHMIQHTGFTLLAPPLLLLGMPSWLWRFLLVDNKHVYAFVRRVSKPWPALIMFHLMTVITHWPFMVDYTLYHHWSHFVVHVVMVLISLNMWLCVVNRIPELPRPAYGVKMGYLFLMSIIPTIPASFLTFGDTVLYKYYARVPRVFGVTALSDQQTAGALMKVYAGSILWGAIILLFFRWYTREQEADKATRQAAAHGMPEVLTWQHVEQELTRTDPVG
jgi:putative membrane protein